MRPAPLLCLCLYAEFFQKTRYVPFTGNAYYGDCHRVAPYRRAVLPTIRSCSTYSSSRSYLMRAAA
ncbi:hypothetical protein [Treponema endosymbiont of Eucomonympha sp.]|uniref:hypothetical protein n=1 Tax=Treponema endosymbiont of Eucomonympha sp. TaxID=1580831 RepID=UPI000A901E4F|nr:hypothetical protein [Treponema endosymbiont of Eucomonympha sp.]